MRAAMYALTFKDKERFLTLFSNRVLTMIAGVFVSVILFVLIYWILVWLKVIEFNLISFIGHLTASLLIGFIAVYLKLLEYRLEMLSYKESSIRDVIPNFLYVFLLSIMILYILGYYFLSVDAKSIKLENVSSLIVIALLGSIIFAYMLSASWSWLYVSTLNLITDIDWIAKFDEDAFYRMLPLKFYESKRYLVPLTLGIVDIENYDELLSKIGKRKVQKLMFELMEDINLKLRFVDLVARIDNGRKIVIIMNIPSASATIPAERVLESIEQFNKKYGLDLKVKGRIVGFSPDMISEMDLLRAEGEEVRLQK
ncbi:MAG: hypothetical protein ACP5PT_05800 [Brevinematia bacterium]